MDRGQRLTRLRHRVLPLTGQRYHAWAGVVLLALAVVVSALAVIYSSYLFRYYFNQQQKLAEQRDALQVEWGQLLLEQSAWAAHGRVEGVVGQQLNMRVPAPAEIIMVKP